MTKNIAERPPLDPAKYNRLVAHATLKEIRLIETRFDSKSEGFTADTGGWNFKITNKLEEWHCDHEAGTLMGIYSYVASCVEGRRKLLSVGTRYQAIYRLSDLCDEEAGRQFLERVGRFAAYPYFRSVFATLTQQSGIILPPLPIMTETPRWVTPPQKQD